MLLNFKIRNFRSIRDEVIVDFVKSGKIKKTDHADNIIDIDGVSVLKSLILYGRNASGKSNILRGLQAFKYIVENSDKFKINDPIDPYEPFLFNGDTKNSPVEFEIVFYARNNIKYRYEIKFDRKTILYEGLYFYPSGSKAKLFERINNIVTYGDYFRGDRKYFEENLLNNQLVLSKSSTSKYEYLMDAYEYISKYIFVYTIGPYENDRPWINMINRWCSKDDNAKKNLKRLIEASDTNIIDFEIITNDESKFKIPPNIPEEIKNKLLEDFKYDIRTKHTVFKNEEIIGTTELKLSDESNGTQKLILIGGLILSALGDGSFIAIDELDKSLHSLLTKLIITLFHSKTNNPFNAQLFFATHDNSLLDNEIFRRDQICFADKEYYGHTELYKLSDIPGVRKEIPIDKWYLSGRFRAIPVTGEIKLDFDGI